MVASNTIDSTQGILKNFALPRLLSTKWNGRDVALVAAGAVAIITLLYLVYAYTRTSAPKFEEHKEEKPPVEPSTPAKEAALVNLSPPSVKAFVVHSGERCARLETELLSSGENTYTLRWKGLEMMKGEEAGRKERTGVAVIDFPDLKSADKYTIYIQAICLLSRLSTEHPALKGLQATAEPVFYAKTPMEKMIFFQAGLCSKFLLDQIEVKMGSGIQENPLVAKLETIASGAMILSEQEMTAFVRRYLRSFGSKSIESFGRLFHSKAPWKRN